MKNLSFKPWIGANYENPKYGKFLILGESHYGDVDSINSNFTTEVLEEYLSGEYYPAYRIYSNLGLIFNENDKYELWNNCAYANLIQHFMNDKDAQPSSAQLESIIPAFWELLELLKPDKIIICSKRMWENWLPDNDSRCRMIDEIKTESKYSSVWEYDHSSGKTLAIGINHPTSIGFSNNEWRPLIQKFIVY
jgi:hypothetical protein